MSKKLLFFLPFIITFESMNKFKNVINQSMLESPVSVLIIKMAIPTIISMLVMSAYGMVDIFFVSRLGTGASAAVGIVFAILTMTQAVGSMIGIGAGNLISESLGANDNKNASNIASVAFFLSIIFGIIVTTLGIIFKEELMNILGATKTILPLAKEFAHYILIASPIICCSYVLNILLRSQGKPKSSMIGLSIGAIVNIILEPIFIFKLNWGIKGAALATATGQTCSFIILLILYISNKKLAKISFTSFIINSKNYITKICSNGSPTLLRQGLVVIANVLVNVTARKYGDSAIAAFSITNRILLIAVSIMFGLGQGFLPVVGFSFGAKKFDRIKKAYFFTTTLGIIILTIIAFFLYNFSTEIIKFFQKDPSVIAIASKVIQYFAISLPLIPLTITTNMIFQVTEKIGISIFLSSCRQGIFFIPLIFILPPALGIKGLELCQPIANIVSALICVPFIILYFKTQDKTQTNNPPSDK